MTVQDSIANQSIDSAISIAASMDVETYQKFLSNPEKNEYYWEIRNYLNDAREKIGAHFVYTLMVDNPKFSKAMIMGKPKDDPIDYPIGTICTVPEEQVKEAFEGKTYVTGPIKDVVYGVEYISVGAPIKDDTGKIIGYIGIDIGVDQLNAIGSKVLEDNLFILNFAFVLIIIITVVFMHNWYRKEMQKEVEDTEDTYQAEIKTLIASVSSLRHDFANHVQVLHGLLLLDKSQQALEYLSTLSKEIHNIQSIHLNIKHPGLSVLLQTKKLSAQNQQIDMCVSVSDDSFDQIKTTDLIKLLSNLIDNAIDASKELPEDQRKISINCQSCGNQYIFKITNSGPKILDKDKIFKQGYSTKTAEHDKKIRGQGLFIVKDIVDKYNGNITISSNEIETSFFVEIPFK
ncbi:sensor histidine kinase [Ureibacillus sp. NPDC094379]